MRRLNGPPLALAALWLAAATASGGPAEPPLPLGAPEADAAEAPDGAPPLPIGAPGAPSPDQGPPLPVIVGPDAEEPPLPLMPEAPPEPLRREAEEHGFSDWLDARLAALPLPVHGFLEVRAGPRIVDDGNQSKSFSLGETRLQLETDPFYAGVQFQLKADLVHDLVLEEFDVELREANAAFSPVDFMDVKVGRQILTWGTGDLVFLNDLFPKDFVSFFSGRDVEYLKAPSDAVKVALYSDLANLDVVYTPRFDHDVFLTGERLSYFNPTVGARAGEKLRLRADEPDSWFDDDEIAARLHRNYKGYELAAYGYHGFWKSPAGVNPTSGLFTFPTLNVVGASARGRAGRGIGNAEVAYYDSADDRSGTNPFVRNSEWRFLLGYSRDMPEIAPEFTVGVQYYLERMEDHGAFLRNRPAGAPRQKQYRHLVTLRLTKLALNQDLQLGFFGFFGLSDDDMHLRPHFSYDVTDRLRVDGGANLFFGSDAFSPFGQLDNNNNVYLGLRYSF